MPWNKSGLTADNKRLSEMVVDIKNSSAAPPLIACNNSGCGAPVPPFL